MNNIDHAKEDFLNYYESISTVDYSKVPAHYFLTSLKNELNNNYVDNPSPNPVWADLVDNIPVNLNGLGLSYEPHKEFLDKLVLAIAKILVKMVRDVGVENTLRYSKDFNIEIV